MLLTGINGFIGSALALELLTHGYSVRGVVRPLSKVGELKAAIPSEHHSRLSFVVVEDIAQLDAYEGSTLQGVDAVIHAASPTLTSWNGAAEIIDTAVTSTTNILRSAGKQASIRRVIYISSLAAVRHLGSKPQPGHRWTDADWNPIARETAYSTTVPIVAYFASKTFAERAAWAFVKQQRPSFDLVTFAFPAVFGPALIRPTTADDLPSSLKFIHRAMEGQPLPTENFVDIRDLVTTIISALRVKQAGGERFLVGAGNCTADEMKALKHAPYVDRCRGSQRHRRRQGQQMAGLQTAQEG